MDQATLTSECQVGAKEFWQVVPSNVLGLAVPAEEFATEVRHRLCMLECQEDDWCPLCDQVLDARGHHPRMCCAGGDRTRRHNATRNKGFNFAKTAGCNPELSAVQPTFTSLPGPMVSLLQSISPSRHLSGKGLWKGQRRTLWWQQPSIATPNAITTTRKLNAMLPASHFCRWRMGPGVPPGLETACDCYSREAVKGKSAVQREMLQSLAVITRRANARVYLRRSVGC